MMTQLQISFLLAILGIVLIITTYFYYQKWKNWDQHVEESHYCRCDGCKKKKAKSEEKNQNKWGFFDWIKLSVYSLVWLLFLFTLVKAYSSGFGDQAKIFDPYEILGLPYGATEADIKTRSRKLKLENHPDKNPENQEKFILIGKASDTLLDPAVREKWEKYGNPDGPQRTSVGMALPAWLEDQQNANVILGLYVLGLVILFPMGVYYWQKSFAGDDIIVSQETMQIFAGNMTQMMSFSNLLHLLSAAREYYDNLPAREADGKVLKELQKLTASYEPKKQKGKEVQRAEYITKDQQLFFAHLLRLNKMLNADLAQDQEFLVGHAPLLCSAMIEPGVARRFVYPTLNAISLSAMIVQAAWSPALTNLKVKDTTFLQLPHVNETFLDMLNNPKNKSIPKIKTLQEFAELDKEKRLQLLEGYTKDQINDIERVLTILPTDLKWTTKVAVDDEDPDLTPNCLATIFITATRPSRPTDPATLEERQKLKKKNKPDNTVVGEPIPVHAPHFPKEKKEVWWFIIGDEKRGALSNIQRCTSLTDSTDVQIKFRAPDKVGNYALTLWIMSDSYIGFNEKITLKFSVVKESTVKLDEKTKKDIKDEDNEPSLLSDDEIDDNSDVDSDEISDSEEE